MLLIAVHTKQPKHRQVALIYIKDGAERFSADSHWFNAQGRYTDKLDLTVFLMLSHNRRVSSAWSELQTETTEQRVYLLIIILFSTVTRLVTHH